MTPLLQFRLWLRRGSGTEKLSATLALIVVVGLVAWLLVPTGTDSDGGSTALTTEAGPDSTTPAGAPLDAPGDVAVDVAVDGPVGGASGQTGGERVTSDGGSAAPGTAVQGGKDCLQAPSGTPGIKDNEILIGLGVIELAGPIGNEAAGQQESGDAQRIGQAVIDDINARGGLQCRKLVAKFYKGNPLNPEQTRATCLQMIQDKVFLVADAFAFAYPAGAYGCLPQQQVPVITSVQVLGSEFKRFSPYLATVTGDAATVMRDVAFGAKALGLFDAAKGFKKLGLLADDCSTEFNGYLEQALAKAGITAAQISKYVFACPTGAFASPSEMSQAVTQHKLAGVTHVIPLTGGGSWNAYTNLAEGQGFRPKYILTDYNGIIASSASSLTPNGDNADRMIAITTGQHGQNSTPGFQPEAGTRRCQGLIVKAGLPPGNVYKGGGTVCSVLWATEAAIKGTRSLTRTSVIPGLFNAGVVQMAFPFIDSAYQAPSKYYGGDSWWPIEWRKECGCWFVLDRNRRPSYPA